MEDRLTELTIEPPLRGLPSFDVILSQHGASCRAENEERSSEADANRTSPAIHFPRSCAFCVSQRYASNSNDVVQASKLVCRLLKCIFDLVFCQRVNDA